MIDVTFIVCLLITYNGILNLFIAPRRKGHRGLQMIYCWSVTERYNCGSKFVKAMHSDSLRRLEFLFHLYLKGRGKVGFIFGIFRFFKMPLQMAIGLYLAFMMVIGTAAGIAYFAEGIDYCNEFKFAVSADKLFPIFWVL